MRARRTQLHLPENLSLASWCQVGEQIQAVTDASAWWIGDWLVYGQNHYADRYRQAMKGTSLNYQTLRNYAWVARKFEVGRRHGALTFHHHMEVAALSKNEQDHWLDFAARLHWTRDELRRQIRASALPEPDQFVEVSAVRLHLRLDEIQLERWRAAAEKSNQNLEDWIRSIVDSAV
ncbi:antibiotic biosynthesis protein [Streptomyces sp. ST1015]|nr:antibiotic biosynthesis protein [Streptomyces sp. ST1015]